MIKILLTGDNHFGLNYSRYPDVAEKLKNGRLQSLQKAVDYANKQNDDFLVVSGDLFDTVKVPSKLVKSVLEILASFEKTVVVIPGNHDYYSGEEPVWQHFEDEIAKQGYNNILLLNEFKPFHVDTDDGEEVYFFPAFCQEKKSDKNSLGWIKAYDFTALPADAYRVGIAHGTIEGIAPDMKNEYFQMSQSELSAIPVDTWLIGHTHIPYPDNLGDEFVECGKIFNAGTHEQTDLANHTDGECFEIVLDQNAAEKVKARKFISGTYHFNDIDVQVSADPDDTDALKNALEEKTGEPDNKTVVRAKVSGTVTEDEYKRKKDVYAQVLGSFLTYEIEDADLTELITDKMIDSEFAETSFAAKFLKALKEDPKELQMAYDIVKRCE